jgi:hypothetical protein
MDYVNDVDVAGDDAFAASENNGLQVVSIVYPVTISRQNRFFLCKDSEAASSNRHCLVMFMTLNHSRSP